MNIIRVKCASFLFWGQFCRILIGWIGLFSLLWSSPTLKTIKYASWTICLNHSNFIPLSKRHSKGTHSDLNLFDIKAKTQLYEADHDEDCLSMICDQLILQETRVSHMSPKNAKLSFCWSNFKQQTEHRTQFFSLFCNLLYFSLFLIGYLGKYWLFIGWIKPTEHQTPSRSTCWVSSMPEMKKMNKNLPLFLSKQVLTQF